MHEIICPHCQKAFKIDEAGYADIQKQVRDSEFDKLREELDKQLHERLALAEQDKRNAIALEQARMAGELTTKAASKDAEIQRLKSQLESEAVARQLAVTSAVTEAQKQRDHLAQQLREAQLAQKTQAELAQARLENELQQAAARHELALQTLKSQLASTSVTHQLALTEAVTKVQQERDSLKNHLDRASLEKELAEKSLKDKYETQLKDRDEAIERLRDMKAKLSTKMVGETLEQHCEIEFNRIRASAFPAPTSRRTTTPAAAARATSSSGRATTRRPKSSRSCSR